MTQINKSHLDFLELAKWKFETNEELHTFRDEDEGIIALRTGADRDCIEIFELGNYVANFVQQLEVEGDK